MSFQYTAACHHAQNMPDEPGLTRLPLASYTDDINNFVAREKYPRSRPQRAGESASPVFGLLEKPPSGPA